MNDNIDDGNDNFEEEVEYVSKTQMKKEMEALQDLAVHLTQLSPEQLAGIPIEPELQRALDETKNIKKREALRRHRQFLGRLMRNANHEAITAALNKIKEDHDRMTRLLHVMEQWRDDLIQGDQSQLERFIEHYPNTDRQQLRNLVRNAKGELNRQKPPIYARKLFRFIRETIASAKDE